MTQGAGRSAGTVRRRWWSVLGALSIGVGAAVVIQPVAGADPNESCSYAYTYSPTATGSHGADTVPSLEGVSYNVSLTGTGTAPIEVSSPTLDHGVVAVGDANTRQVTVTNISTIVRTPTVAGGLLAGNPDFSVTENCSGGPPGDPALPDTGGSIGSAGTLAGLLLIALGALALLRIRPGRQTR